MADAEQQLPQQQVPGEGQEEEVDQPLPAIDEPFLQGVLRSHLRDDGLVVDKVDVGPGSGPGDNYMSTVYSAVVRGKTGRLEAFEEQLVVKLWPADAKRRRLFRCAQAFSREACGYGEVVPRLGAAAAALFPRCLYASPAGVVVLQDLRPLGFRMADRRVGLDLPHAELAIRKLAQFHATTLVLKRDSPETAERLRRMLQPDLTFATAARLLTSDSVDNAVLMAVESLSDERQWDEPLRAAVAAVRPLRDQLYDRLRRLLADVDEATAVVCHGDSSANNMLFQYDDQLRPQDLRFLDMQVLRYASAATDVMYLLFTTVQSAVLSEHLQDLVGAYHEQLQHEAAGAADHITLDHLHSEVQRHALWGLLMGFWLMPAMMISPQNVPSMEGSESLSKQRISEWARKLGPDYRVRIESIMRSYITLLRSRPGAETA
ncbi:uncharacterized protein LOC126235568 [Schistocerca nitens]|uniref:uncharacterized protein LOC126235568 n=1 Tax=Schistocerca nitens TaxID=7011 RepID=UPI0021184C6A|nr:uncharacterized protein LOC126235568 [Schistocerca nitens]